MVYIGTAFCQPENNYNTAFWNRDVSIIGKGPQICKLCSGRNLIPLNSAFWSSCLWSMHCIVFCPLEPRNLINWPRRQMVYARNFVIILQDSKENSLCSCSLWEQTEPLAIRIKQFDGLLRWLSGQVAAEQSLRTMVGYP